VVFCDFDGTLTQKDVVVMVMERFAPPQWQAIAHAMLETKTLSLREGIAQLFALLPSHLAPDIEAFVRTEVTLREGFTELLTTCQAQGIPFYVVSGGLDVLIQPVLQPYAGQYHLFCNVANFSQATMQVATPYLPQGVCQACNHCACCKVAVLNLHPATAWYRVAVGDGLTDWGMSHHADAVFARGSLARDMKAQGLPFTHFKTLHTVNEELVALLNVQ
jgi:2-hydroxy-3-keto-5-methylthiopentenyl-1-phosphate phosphatase